MNIKASLKSVLTYLNSTSFAFQLTVTVLVWFALAVVIMVNMAGYPIEPDLNNPVNTFWLETFVGVFCITGILLMALMGLAVTTYDEVNAKCDCVEYCKRNNYNPKL